ncbi:MAG: PAS domain-containing protein [Proteobacteria bacterium]|nr:PAS domain-containing protein [Pseudomonadota bacterium]
MPQHPRIIDIIDFWKSCQPRIHGLPVRQSVDPFALRPWLGHCAIYEAIAGDDFKVRLEGSFISEMGGENWTGHRASEIDSRYQATLLRDLRDVSEARTFRTAQISIVQANFIRIERALLPVTLGGGAVDQIIGCIYRIV